jgi:Ser/Thr protein kinase RdoA (MazF antagonist)
MPRVHPPTDEGTVRTVLGHYDLGETSRIAPLSGGTANRNFLVSTARGEYFFRALHLKYSSAEHVRLDHALKRHLVARGAPVVAPVATREGETVVLLRKGYYELYPYRPGEAFRWEREEELGSAARALALCHKALADFPRPAGHLRRKDSSEAILEGLHEIRALTRDRRILDEIAYLAQQAERISDALPDEKYFALPCQMIHGDYHPANVVFKSGDVSGIYDWDCAAYLPRARDVADGLLYFAARREGGFDATNIVTLTKCCRPDKRRFDVFLRAYEGENPLTEAERAGLPWFLRARWIFSRVEGRLKIPRDSWPPYLVDGIRPLLTWCDESVG